MCNITIEVLEQLVLCYIFCFFYLQYSVSLCEVFMDYSLDSKRDMQPGRHPTASVIKSIRYRCSIENENENKSEIERSTPNHGGKHFLPLPGSTQGTAIESHPNPSLFTSALTFDDAQHPGPYQRRASHLHASSSDSPIDASASVVWVAGNKRLASALPAPG